VQGHGWFKDGAGGVSDIRGKCAFGRIDEE